MSRIRAPPSSRPAWPRAKATARASQPAIRASSHVRGAKSTSPTVNPMDAATTSRRRGGACQPNHRWYVVSGGIAAIGSGLSDLDGSLEPADLLQDVRLTPHVEARRRGDV